MSRVRERMGSVLLLSSGVSARQRALRLIALICLCAGVVLFGLALKLALTPGPPVKRALKPGVVFNQALVAAATAPQTATAPVAAPSSPSPTAATAPPAPSPTAGKSTDTPVASPAATDAPPSATPTPAPAAPPSDSPIVRLIIPKIKVNASTEVKGLKPNGEMQEPGGWAQVAYYDFSGRPGFGPNNNVVFAGHVDYINHGAAVFWDLDKLKPNDEVHVVLQDGTDYLYRVVQMVVYDADSAPVQAIVGATNIESVTLITCNGTFSAGHYNNRLVVRAERADSAAPAANAAGG